MQTVPELAEYVVALKQREEGLAVLQDGLDADPGDLPEDQAVLLRGKMQTLIKDLEKNLSRA